MVADLAVFDPKTVTDNSTYEQTWKPATGMKDVIVNGTVVVRDGRILPVYPGQPNRFDLTRPKFEPASREHWGERFMISVELPGERGDPQPDTHRRHFDRPART